MSKKVIAKAIKNVRFAGDMQAWNIKNKSHDYDYYAEVKKNADALSLLGVMDWVPAFDMLYSEYIQSLKESTELAEWLENRTN